MIDGERQINTQAIAAMGTASNPPRPLGIRVESIGGGSQNAYTPGITGVFGLNNIGLLVKTWGTVISVVVGSFVLQGVSPATVDVKIGTLTAPVVGKYVAVTGISSCEVIGGAISRDPAEAAKRYPDY